MSGLKIGILTKRTQESYSIKRLKEEIEKRGHTSLIIDYERCDLEVYADDLDIFYEGESLKDLDAVIPRITTTNTAYGLAVLRQCESLGIFTTNSSLALTKARDKLHTLQMLAKKGLPFPKTATSNNTDNSQKIIDTLNGAPLVIKLLEGMQGVGTILTDTNKGAVSVIDALSNLKTSMILQEYIKEAEGRDIRVFVVGDHIVASMERVAKEGDFRSNLHRGGSASAIDLNSNEMEISIKAASILGLNIAGVDLIHGEDGPLILEVNSSPGLEGIEIASGINVAETIVGFIEDNLLNG